MASHKQFFHYSVIKLISMNIEWASTEKQNLKKTTEQKKIVEPTLKL